MVDFNVYKIQGCGNSFVVCSVEELRSYSTNIPIPSVLPNSIFQEFIQKICSNGFGLGADGAMIVGKIQGAGELKECEVFMYNPDGSWMGMCGNGIRCVMRYLAMSGEIAANRLEKVAFNIGKRKVVCSSEDGGKWVTVDMGIPVLTMSDLPALVPDGEVGSKLTIQNRSFVGTCVGMGNPHFVIFEEIDSLEIWGPLIETNATFPAKINVEFVTIESPNKVSVRVWERGAGATLACGTGACAVTVAGVLTGKTDRTVTVQLPGGELKVEWREADNRVYLSGPSQEIAVAAIAV